MSKIFTYKCVGGCETMSTRVLCLNTGLLSQNRSLALKMASDSDPDFWHNRVTCWRCAMNINENVIKKMKLIQIHKID